MSTVLDTISQPRRTDMNVGDRVFAAFTSTYGGDIKGCCHEREIAAMYGGRVMLEYVLMPDGSRASDEPSQGREYVRYFTTEREARQWLAAELRKIGHDYAAKAEAAALEQERIGMVAARGVVTV